MGHLGHHKAHRDLQQHLDHCHTGFPESPLTMEVLRLLFTPQEAELVARLPFRPMSARAIGRRLQRPAAEVARELEHLADKGLILDLYNAKTERMYYCVAPPVVGFIEFTMMRRRTDVDQPALAKLFDRFYEAGGPDALGADETFIGTLFGGATQVGRTLVHEPTLAPDDLAELVDHDRAVAVIESATNHSVSMCYCRHKSEHLGHRCDKPIDNCLSINSGADFVLRHGNGRQIDKVEALEILERSREAGLVTIGDNVQRRLTYLCNCCGCCCGQLQAINRSGIGGAVKTSGHIAAIDYQDCSGCGRCARVCPIQAISLKARPQHERSNKRMVAEVDERICLGCGVCEPACQRTGALTMERRAERVLTPEGMLERVLSMALERGRLHHLLFEQEDGPHMLLLNRLAGLVLALPPVRQALLQDELKSRFVGFLSNKLRGKSRAARTI